MTEMPTGPSTGGGRAERAAIGQTGPTLPTIEIPWSMMEAYRSAWGHPTRDAAMDLWGAALQRGDDDEVDRLVRQSRVDRREVAVSGELGPMLGQSGQPRQPRQHAPSRSIGHR